MRHFGELIARAGGEELALVVDEVVAAVVLGATPGLQVAAEPVAVIAHLRQELS